MVLDDFQHVVALLGAERFEAAIVEDQQLDAAQGAHQPGIAAVTAGQDLTFTVTVTNALGLSSTSAPVVVTVPPGARTGQVSVTVKNKKGTSKDNFTVPGTKWTFMVYVDGDNNLDCPINAFGTPSPD